MDKDLKHECPKCKGLFYQAGTCSKCVVSTRPLIAKTDGRPDVPCSDVLSDMPMTLGDMVERAAKHLPEGYIIDIQIEKDGYGVGLITKNGRLDLDGGDGMISDINEGISVANGFGR